MFQACSKVVKFISYIAQTIHGSLDGKNVEVVLTELGTRLQRVIYEHLLQFQYNSLGKLYCENYLGYKMLEYNFIIKNKLLNPKIWSIHYQNQDGF